MWDGLYYGCMMILGALTLLGLLGDNPGMSIVMLIIAGIWLAVRLMNEEAQKNDPNEAMMMDWYRKKYPYWNDQQIYQFREKERKELMRRASEANRRKR